MTTKRRLATCAVMIAILLGAVSLANADEVDEVLRKFEHEPTIRDVQKAAISYYKVDPDTINTMRSRTKTKALLPALSIGVTNSLSSYNNDIDDIVFRERGIAIRERQTADFLGVSGSVSWRLDRLVFNVEELDVLSLVGIQDGIQREVTALYYVRRRLQIQLLLNPPKALEGRISARLRLEELTGLLDAYTGGFFSKKMGKPGARATGRFEQPDVFGLDPGTRGWVQLPGVWQRPRARFRMRHRD